MTTPHDANDLLFGGGGAPALQWAHPETRQDYPVGTSYEGEILRTDARQQRDINDKSKIAYWPDGSIKYVAIVTIQTSLRDPAVEGDDGERSLWVSGKYLTNAVKGAVRKTGAKELEAGGHLKVTLTGYGKAEGGYRPPRLFDVVYTRPTPEKQAEIQARHAAERAADPWAQADASDPWGTAPQPVYDQGGFLPPGERPVVGAGPARPAGDLNAPSYGVGQSNLSPEAQALIQRSLAQQQGGTR